MKLLTIVAGLILAGSVAAADFNVRSYGATGQGLNLETVAIQRAIDACSAHGGGTVLVPPGKYLIGTVRLRSHVTLDLSTGSILLGSQNLADYATDLEGAVEAPAYNRCLIYGEKVSHVSVRGAGIIDGQGSRTAFPVRRGERAAERPMLIRMVHCDDLTFTDSTFRNPAAWGIHLVDCRQVHFDRISIFSRDNNSNNDGIDLDGCRGVVIEHCRIDSNDDAICLKSTTDQHTADVVVRNCDLSSATGGFKLGTSSRAGFRHIQASDLYFHDCPMGAVKLLLVDGGLMEDIELSRLTMKRVGGPIFIRLGNRGRRYERPADQRYDPDARPEGRPVGAIRNLSIRHVSAEIDGDDLASQGVFISGITDHRIENLVLEDLDLRFGGKACPAPVDRAVPEDAARYPEQAFFGVPPAWGLFVRHVQGLTLRNVRLHRTQADARRPNEFLDVGALDTSGLSVETRPGR